MTHFKPARAALALGLALSAFAAPSLAAEFEVHMLNKGEKGTMVFEPDFIQAEVGDTIRFIPTDAGHNAETIKGMFPAGFESFKSAPNEEFTVVLNEEGVYGIRCTPHYAMGMVALIVAGEPVNAEEALAGKHPGKANARFAELFETLNAL